MIVQTFEFSIAAGAASTNVMPSSFNPVPADGFLDIFALLDGAIVGLTAPPKVEIIIGGTQNSTPVNISSITGSPYNTGAANSFQDPSVCPVVRRLPIRQGTNSQLNVSGGTGATATGRFRVFFYTAAEAAAGAGA